MKSLSLNGAAKVVGAELNSSEQDKKKMLAKTFVNFSKHSVISEATCLEAFFCTDMVKSARYYFGIDEFRATNPLCGTTPAANAPKSTSGIDSSSSSNTIAL